MKFSAAPIPISLLFFSVFQISFAQYAVSGKIIEENQQPVAYANVACYKQADSAFVKGTISNDDGVFQLKNLQKGEYWLQVSFIGFESISENVSLEKDLELAPFLLKEKTGELESVQISVKRPTTRKEADRLIFNVENTSLSSGSSWDILQQTPGVINVQGNLKIRNATATVYINDKKVRLTHDELQQLLQSYSGSNIKEIEVITNPPAKYDAEDGPILNIVTSKMLIPGYKGSVEGSYTQAVFAKYQLGTSHYYKTEKLNLFANYSFSPKKEFKNDESYINFQDEQGTEFSKWRTDFERTTHSYAHNANVILDYNLDEKNTLSLNSTVIFSPNKKFDNQVETYIFGNQNKLDSLFRTDSGLKNDLLNTDVDLSYSHQFEKENTQFSVSAHYTYFDEDKDQRVLTNYFNAEKQPLNQNYFATQAGQKINIVIGQADFETVFGKYNFETGAKISNINSTSGIDYNHVNSDASTFDTPNLSDHFDYDETVTAGYVSADRSWSKFEAKAGMRAEYTDRKGFSRSMEQTNSRDYFELFPTVYLSYEVNEHHSFSFDYGRKISRPRYESLNPYRYFLNENNYQSGNPNLKASISNEYNLNYTLNNEYSFDFYYRENGREATQLVFQDNQNLNLRSIYANVEESKSYGIDYFHGKSLKSWWYGQIVMSLYHEVQTFLAVESKSERVKNDINGFYANMYNSFTFSQKHNFSGHVSLTYLSKLLQGSYEVGEMTTLSFGLRKTFWNGNGEVTLNIADLLNETAPVLKSKYKNQDNGYFAQPENRYVRIGFKYKFGNSGLKDNERKVETEESERL